MLCFSMEVRPELLESIKLESPKLPLSNTNAISPEFQIETSFALCVSASRSAPILPNAVALTAVDGSAATKSNLAQYAAAAPKLCPVICMDCMVGSA